MLKIIIVWSMVAVVLTGCSSAQLQSTSPTDLVTPISAAAGAGIGLYATEGKSIGTQAAATGAGGALGWMLGDFINKGFKKEKMKEFQAGYDLGRSNSTKELYWAMQKLNEAKDEDNSVKLKLIKLPAPKIKDGIKYVPHNIEIPVVQ